jgi:hypothetical protein
MFLLTLSSLVDGSTLVSRGVARYTYLYRELLGPKLHSSAEKLGPLILTTLATDRATGPLLVSSDRRTVAIIGHPSCLASAGTDVTGFARERLEGSPKIDDFVRELQGDFVVLLMDHETGKWELAIDSVGLARLYLLPLGDGLLLSDKLYLLAACTGLELDPVGCSTLDLCGYILGNRTVFKDVRLVEMGQTIQGDQDSWHFGHGWHFVDSVGGDSSVDKLAGAFLDAAEPRFASASGVRHCSTGGTDSRLVLGLMVHLGMSPTVFCWRWDKDDVRIAHALANELGLEFHSTVIPNFLGPSRSAHSTVLAEALLLDGGLTGAFTMRSYYADLGPSEMVTTGSYGESTIKSAWGIGYAGMVFPNARKVIDRLLAVSLIRPRYDSAVFAQEGAVAAVEDYLRSVLESQASAVSHVDCVKLCNYFYLRNRGARWAAQILAAANQLARTEFPLSYAAGVCASWLLPPEQYKDLGAVRGLLWNLDPRLTRWRFNDGSPAVPRLRLADKISMIANRKVRKGVTAITSKFLGITPSKSRGNLRPQAGREPDLPLWQRWPQWATDTRQRLTTSIYRPFGPDQEALHDLNRQGHLRCVATLEFASRVYDGEL